MTEQSLAAPVIEQLRTGHRQPHHSQSEELFQEENGNLIGPSRAVSKISHWSKNVLYSFVVSIPLWFPLIPLILLTITEVRIDSYHQSCCHQHRDSVSHSDIQSFVHSLYR